MRNTALITGGAKRIGRHIALKLAENGYNIAIHYNKSLKEAKELKKIIIDKSVNCEIFKADLSKDKDILNLINKVKNHFPDLNILINNASIFNKAKINETSIKLFNDAMNINFKAPFFLSQTFAKNIKKGQIINLIDTKISKNNFNYSIYTLSKKLLAEFTKMAAKEFSPNIQVNGICPGLILPPEGNDENYLKELAKNIPLKKIGSLNDITDALLFLLKSDFITGQLLFIDGGQNL